VTCWKLCDSIALSVVQGVESDGSVLAYVCTGSLLAFWHTRRAAVVGWTDGGG